MSRFLAPLAFAATLAATSAFAQSPAPVHSATVNNVKVSGVVAASTSTSTAVGGGGHDAVANLLDNFTSAQPVLPVLAPPAGAPHPGAGKDCATGSC